MAVLQHVVLMLAMTNLAVAMSLAGVRVTTVTIPQPDRDVVGLWYYKYARRARLGRSFQYVERRSGAGTFRMAYSFVLSVF